VYERSFRSTFNRDIVLDQTGYIKNRLIGFNLRQIQDIIDYSNIYKIEGAIIFLDFSKAFDSLEWDFWCKGCSLGIMTIMKYFGIFFP
jgi:hypothetical protein